MVDLTTGAAGSLATCLLSEHGARVIRVVETEAQVFREGGFVVWDRGKECIRLDWGDLDELIQTADVLVEDLTPSDPRQRYVDYERLRQTNPSLVSCSITAYGKRGPWKDEPPIDDLVLARLGVLSAMPGHRPPPVHLVHPLPSVGAALLAAIGISAALYAREETGRGRTVETSLMAGTLMYHPKVAGTSLEVVPFQTHPAGSAAFYANYECSDCKWVQIGCVHPAFVASAAAVMGIEETLADPRFGDGRPPDPDDALELRAIVEKIVRTKPYEFWAQAFEEADVPYAQARWTEDSLDDPQVLYNEMAVELDDPVHGKVTQMGVGLKLSETPGRIQGPRRPDVARASGGQRRPQVDVSSDPSAPPLAGIRLLEISNLIAGPNTGRLLADLGADVIKIEPPGGDIARPLGRTYFYGVNFNKRSVCVDARTPEGKEVVQRIAATSDILLANLRPGATERMGIGPALNPNLIEIHLTGYGWTGPYSKRAGIDPLASAYIGLLRAQGGRENPPVFPAELAPTDYTTGAVGALGAVLCLLTRKRSGIVQRGESNLLYGAVLLCSQWFTQYAGRPSRPLADKEQLGLSDHHRLFRVADGWIYVAADENQDAFRPIADTLADLTVAECLERLAAVGVPASPVLSGYGEAFLDQAHAVENSMVAERQHPSGGAMRFSWNYIRFGGTRPSGGRPTPLLGEQTREVLADVGFAADEVERFYEAGVVKTERA